MNEPGKNSTRRESPRTRTRFSAFSFSLLAGDRYSRVVAEVDRIKYGSIKDEVTDGAVLSKVLLDKGSKPIPVVFNRYNFKKILWHHGYFRSINIVVTANEFEEGVYIKGVDGRPDKINLIKNTDGGCYIIGANRFNGYGVVTFFEQCEPSQKQQYLASMRKRGTPLQVLEGGGSS
ncbi:hypothetical protein KGQ27_00595 [Patescibacteria group bacterium]|nr:hypothetical protein [Patescibacteria group bacterium]MDE1946845.1 hypothetical protein [Patescibacteria group bacterium]MDE2010665.1 hypothetical protein [Patescibacteria group bacterium]MDE2232729.1 hypothetical protein [Patescibacteria group bacterium]